MYGRPRNGVRTAVISGLLLAAILTALVAGTAAPAARADIFAVTDRVAPAAGRTDTDIAWINTSTGNVLALPAAVNTTDDEFHPSVTSDGKRLVFRRRGSGGSNRIVMADLSTGAMSDLFTGFEVGSFNPTTPSITPDGSGVLTGGSGNGPVLTDVSNFPAGPYPHTALTDKSQTSNPIAVGSAAGSLMAFDQFDSATPLVRFGNIGQTSFGIGSPPGEHSAHPTIASPAGTKTIVFDLTGSNGKGSLLTCSPVNPVAAGCAHQTLPGTHSTDDDTRPAFTADGRYVGFIRTATDGSGQLIVWDSETQTLISNFALTPTADDVGYVSLYERPLFKLATFNLNTGLVNFRLNAAANVGILVQKVTGHRQLFGRKAPKLGKARRVPLGHFKRGKGRAHWSLEVGGRRLSPGTYQVTIRALTNTGRIRDLGKPQLLHIRRH